LRTFRRFSSLTVGILFITRETVVMDTPHRLATSLMEIVCDDLLLDLTITIDG